MSKLKRISKITARILLWVIAVVLVLFVTVVLLIRTPWAQQKIVNAATNFVEKKINTPFSIEKLYLTFDGNLQVEGLYAADQQMDTLLYSRSLEVGVSLMPLLNGDIQISGVDWDGLTANVSRTLPDSSFNFDYIIEAFAGEPKEDKPKAEKKEALELKVGPVNLTNFDLSYTDEVAGLDAELLLGKLYLRTGNLNIDSLQFHVKEMLLENTSGAVVMNKAPDYSEEAADTLSDETGTMPRLRVDELNINNVNLSYSGEAQGIKALADIGRLELELPLLNLATNEGKLDKFLLANSSFDIQIPEGDTTDQETETQPLALPGWDITAGEIELENTQISFKQGEHELQENYFDPKNIRINNLNFLAQDLYLGEEKAGLEIEKFTIRDRSGFEVKELSLKVALERNSFRLKDLHLLTGHSRLDADVQAAFSFFEKSLDKVEDIPVELHIKESLLSLKDARYFVPDAFETEPLSQLLPHPLKLNTRIEGRLGDMRIYHIHADWKESTRLSLAGRIQGLPDMEMLWVDIPELSLFTTTQDFAFILPKSQGGVDIPKNVKVQGRVKGNQTNAVASLQINLPQGELNINGEKRGEAFEAKIKAKDFELGEILQQEDLGRMNFVMNASGSGTTLANMQAELTSSFSEVVYKGYDYGGLELSGSLNGQMANLQLAFSDSNLQVGLIATANLDTNNTAYQVKINLDGANFRKLQLTKDDIRARLSLEARFNGKPDNFTARLETSNGLIIKNRKSYPIEPLLLTAVVNPTQTTANLNSMFAEAAVIANRDPETLAKAIKEHLYSYFPAEQKEERKTGDISLSARVEFFKSDLLSEVLVPGLNALDSAKVVVSYRQKQHFLKANASFPLVKYKETTAEDVFLEIDGTGEKLILSAGFDNVLSGPVDIHKTVLRGRFSEDTMDMEVNIHDEKEATLLHLQAEIESGDDSISIQVDSNLVLQREKWNIPQGNRIVLAKNLLRFQQFEINKGEESLAIKSVFEGDKEKLVFDFNRFSLGTITCIANCSRSPVEGMLHGNVELREIFDKPAFTADIQLMKLTVLQERLGTLSLNAHSEAADNYKIDANMRGGKLNFDLAGNYKAKRGEPYLDFAFDLNQLELSVLESLTDSAVRKTKGILKGELDIKGSPTDLVYNGSLEFERAQFNLAALNSTFKLNEEKITLDEKGIYLNRFTLVDERGKKAVLDGKVLTANYSDPDFNLTVKSRNFELLNSERKDNDLYYGRVLIDTDINIKGSASNPKINARVKLNEGTDIHVIIPESQAEVIERDGVVIFVNMEQPNDPLTNETERKVEGFKGVDLQALIQIDPETRLQLILDERSGDNLQLQGEANLNLNMDANGRVGLTGSYEINDGSYKMSLYGLVKKEFFIVPGSRISWYGEPTEAVLDIVAKYKVRTSALDLMSTQLTGADPAQRSRYRQQLNFEVFLNIKGELLKPEIYFALDMPENQRGALGGSVYSRIRQLNDEEAELNKQVFALLVFNRFLPGDAGTDDGGGGTSALARSSVSQLLSGQLNQLSAKYLKGVEVDVNLDSYTDYESGGDERTQLNVNLRKRLFNERVIVQVGSQVDLEGEQSRTQNAADIVGDVSVEYLITEDGIYRVKGFRKNEYEALIEGQLIVNGISLVFLKEFNTIDQIFKKPEPVEEEEELPRDYDEPQEQEELDRKENKKKDE